MARYYEKDFWSEENLKYRTVHHRLEKSARIVARVAKGRDVSLLDVGCGPATLRNLLPQNVHYHGIDIAIHEPAPNLIEADFLQSPIRFDGKRFDIVVAEGVFEYVGEHQSQKFEDIAEILNENGTFIVSYVNFGHRDRKIYWPYNNICAIDDFLADLTCYFDVRRLVPTSHNWNHSEPNRAFLRAMNMHVNVRIPYLSTKLAVEYFFICSLRETRAS